MLKLIKKFLFNSSFAKKKIILKEIFFTDKNENIERVINLIRKTSQPLNNNHPIIDIGAFDGETALLFSKAFPGTKIIAFEANQKVYETALKKTSHDPNITIHNCAISNKKETATFYVTKNDVSSSLNQINDVNTHEYRSELNVKNKVIVEAEKLDAYTGDKEILLLKIDTQGHEMQVLEGARYTLNNTRFILIEMSNHNLYVNGCKYYEVDEYLRRNGFMLVDIIVTFRKKGIIMTEYDAIYVNNKYPLS